MTNTMNVNSANLKGIAESVMKDVTASGTAVSTMDDMYKAVCKYAEMTREQFDEYYNRAKGTLTEWKNEELNEADLEAVVGGNAFTDWFKDHALAIGIVVGIALLATGVGAGVGAGLYAVAGAVQGCVISEVAATGATVLGSMAGVCAVPVSAAYIYDECKNNSVSNALGLN